MGIIAIMWGSGHGQLIINKIPAQCPFCNKETEVNLIYNTKSFELYSVTVDERIGDVSILCLVCGKESKLKDNSLIWALELFKEVASKSDDENIKKLCQHIDERISDTQKKIEYSKDYERVWKERKMKIQKMKSKMRQILSAKR